MSKRKTAEPQSRRIAKQELVNGQTVKTLYLYDGWDIVAVMNAQGQLRETFTRGVGLAGDPAGAGLVAVTHHAGSWTNGTFYTHHNHRGDVVLTRSGTTTVGTYSYSAFGNLSSVLGPDICRFKFSSKERDAATGLSYYGYRFYVPQWQRWISRDPADELSESLQLAILAIMRLRNMEVLPRNNMQSVNTYLFVGNKSVTHLDTVGLWSYPGCWKDCMRDVTPDIGKSSDFCLKCATVAGGGLGALCVGACALTGPGFFKCALACLAAAGVATSGGVSWCVAAAAVSYGAAAAGCAAGCLGL